MSLIQRPTADRTDVVLFTAVVDEGPAIATDRVITVVASSELTESGIGADTLAEDTVLD